MQPLSIPPGPIKLSIDEYMELPNDGKRYQILDGVLDVTPAPNPRHQRVSRRLQWHLMEALERTGRGEVFDAPTDVILDRHNVVQPDLIFIPKDRLGIIGEKNVQGVPDLVIEILSPSTRRTDVLVKSEIYARFGVPHYWVVDPDIDRVEIYRLAGKAYQSVRTASAPAVLEHEDFPGLRIPLAEVFV